MPEFYHSVTEAAEAIGVAPSTVTRWMREGRLPYKRDGVDPKRGRPEHIIAHADLIEAYRKVRFEETPPEVAPMLTLDNVQAAREDALSLQVVWPLEQRQERYTPAVLEGFSDFWAVTYTPSIPTVLKLLERGNYERFEVVFGDEKLVRETAAGAIIQAQNGIELELNAEWVAIGGMSDPRSRALLEWQESGIARFMTFGGGIVHSKYYLLARPGVQRVLMGSANLSERAFSGRQGEMLLAFDNDPFMWDLAESKFRNLWRFALPLDLGKQPVKKIGLVPADTPVGRAANAQGESGKLELTVYRPSSDGEGITEFIETQQEQLKQLTPFYAHVLPQPVNGAVKVTPANLRVIKNNQDRQVRGDVVLRPHRLDYAGGRYIHDGEPIQRPDEEEDAVAQDAYLITAYIDKFREFGPGYEGLQRGYYAFMGWLYFTPFMPRLRAKLEDAGRVAKAEAKLIAVVYGPTNAGKTTLMRFLLRSMFGPPQVLGNAAFTRTQVEDRWATSGYLPLFYDDVAANRFASQGGRGGANYPGEEIARAYDRCRDIYPEGYPCLTVSANPDAYGYSEPFRERSFMVHAWPGLPGDRSELKARLANESSELSNRIGRAFYAEYLYRMESRFNAADLDDFDYLWESTSIIRDILDEARRRGDEPTNPPQWARPVARMQYDDSAWDIQRKQLVSRLGAESHSPDGLPGDGGWTALKDCIVLGVGEDFNLAKRKYLVPESILDIAQCQGKYLYLDKTKTLDFIRRGENLQEYEFPAIGGLGEEKKRGFLARVLRRGL